MNRFVLVLDDDPDFNRLIQLILKKFGLRSEAVRTKEEFFERFRRARPSLCLVDLNLSVPGDGLEVIRAIRGSGDAKTPILMVSADSYRKVIAEAIELGANDYLIKPLDREVLVSKLSDYLTSEELVEADQGSAALQQVATEIDGAVALDFEVLEIDEMGMKIVSPHVIPKGTVVALSGDFVREVSRSDKPLLLTVTSTWAGSPGYEAFLEFDPGNEELLRSVRQWLAQSREGS